MKARIEQNDGTPLTETDRVTFVNSSLQALFRQVDLNLNQSCLKVLQIRLIPMTDVLLRRSEESQPRCTLCYILCTCRYCYRPNSTCFLGRLVNVGWYCCHAIYEWVDAQKV